MFADLAHTIAERIQQAFPGLTQTPGKVSLWLRLVRYVRSPEGFLSEETVGATTRIYMTALSAAELTEQIAQNVILKVYGEEIQTLKTLPNLVVRIERQKARVAMPEAPPIDAPDQVFLKVTAFAYTPSLWDRLFGRGDADQSEAITDPPMG